MENKRRKKNNGLQDSTHEPSCDSQNCFIPWGSLIQFLKKIGRNISSIKAQ